MEYYNAGCVVLIFLSYSCENLWLLYELQILWHNPIVDCVLYIV